MNRSTWFLVLLFGLLTISPPVFALDPSDSTAASRGSSLQTLMQLALKSKRPTCAPYPCYQKNIGWCICCGDVIDCRAATGGGKVYKRQG